MSLTDLMWLATASYSLHILEEYQLNWRDWARAVVALPVEWSDFYVVNALVIVLGIVAANLAASRRKTDIALNRSAVGERAATTSTAMWIIFLGDDCLI